MPVGVNSPASLIPNPDQREYLYHFVRKMRSEKPLFTLDFQNDGELEAQETAEELCGKTKQASLDWAPYARRLWNNPHDPLYHKRHETDDQGMAETDMNKFKRIGRVRTHGEE